MVRKAAPKPQPKDEWADEDDDDLNTGLWLSPQSNPYKLNLTIITVFKQSYTLRSTSISKHVL